MHYNHAYLEELEDCIMDDLLPMYIIGCRSVGVDPRTNVVLDRLMQAKKLKEEVPFLLRKDSDT